ncbi:hypothetical protein T4D_14461 [Trichinella pseudospiralis]|uniref:Uncharacterized protein n=1 Tax=Trichinella pseudospiralis TaxID=6337 RepID=A0A0V1FAU2_TRIPS|nr:hypothetical protein T4D_14461 [Trichinella pseudospiralis]
MSWLWFAIARLLQQFNTKKSFYAMHWFEVYVQKQSDKNYWEVEALQTPMRTQRESEAMPILVR